MYPLEYYVVQEACQDGGPSLFHRLINSLAVR